MKVMLQVTRQRPPCRSLWDTPGSSRLKHHRTATAGSTKVWDRAGERPGQLSTEVQGCGTGKGRGLDLGLLL